MAEPAVKRVLSNEAEKQRDAFAKLSREDLERRLEDASTLVALLAFKFNGRYKVDMTDLRDFVTPFVQKHLKDHEDLMRQYNEPAVLYEGLGAAELRRQMIRHRDRIEAYLYAFCEKK